MRRSKKRQGSQHPSAKLCEADVELLRQLRAEGHTYQELATRFGVSASNIGWILGGHHWKHVARVPITAEHLRGLPGLRQAACDAIVAGQPATVLEALRIPDVGRKTTARLIALGLITDTAGAQRHTLAEVEKRLRKKVSRRP